MRRGAPVPLTLPVAAGALCPSRAAVMRLSVAAQ
jgi:hypothetical protein